MILRWASALLLMLVGCFPLAASAEPYLAVRSGQPCAVCHVNQTGGGLRTVFGDLYGQTQMPAEQVDLGSRGPFLGNVNEWLRVGSNFRDDLTYTDVPHQKKADSFGVEDFRLYGAATFLGDHVTLYVDQRLAPGGTENREAFALLSWASRGFYLKAGQFYLPFGFRLQDDSAFIQQASGINYTTPDSGVEVGWAHGRWSAELAVTNGNSGAAGDNNQGKQATANVVYLEPGWRVGTSFSDNEATEGRRTMEAVYAGLRTGPIAWLAQAEFVADSSVQPKVDEYAGLLEADWAFLPGHNLKATAEYLDPHVHVAHDGRNRFSLVWEFTPVQFIQARVGVRDYNGPSQVDIQNEREGFVELHLFF